MAPNRRSQLLTGVTGALGAHLVDQLAARSDVGTIWTMVRAADDTAATTRLQKSLLVRGIKLNPEQENKIVALSCDLSKSDLGLSQHMFSELSSKVTMIIHSAWAVNFNIPVQSFEDQHIKAVWNLIQLSLSVHAPQPARFYFCSSVSSAGASPRPGTVPESIVSSPAYAQRTGYAQSKYVTEHVARNAVRSVGAHARVLRIGQLVGDTKIGTWNTTEGIPMMIQTAQTLGALPELNEVRLQPLSLKYLYPLT